MDCSKVNLKNGSTGANVKELQNYLTTNLYEENTFEYKDVNAFPEGEHIYSWYRAKENDINV